MASAGAWTASRVTGRLSPHTRPTGMITRTTMTHAFMDSTSADHGRRACCRPRDLLLLRRGAAARDISGRQALSHRVELEGLDCREQQQAHNNNGEHESHPLFSAGVFHVLLFN